MIIEDMIREKNYNMILTENLHKYCHYNPKKMININVLKAKKYYLLIKV